MHLFLCLFLFFIVIAIFLHLLGYNIQQNPALIDYSDCFDTALMNLKESALTAEFRTISGELDIKTPMTELFKACTFYFMQTLFIFCTRFDFNLHSIGEALKSPNPQPKDLVENSKIAIKSRADVVAICKSLTHCATPEVVELIKELAVDMTDATTQLIPGNDKKISQNLNICYFFTNIFKK